MSDCRIDSQNLNKLSSGGEVDSSLLGGSLHGLLLGLGSGRSLVISFVGSLLFLEVLGQSFS